MVAVKQCIIEEFASGVKVRDPYFYVLGKRFKWPVLLYFVFWISYFTYLMIPYGFHWVKEKFSWVLK